MMAIPYANKFNYTTVEKRLVLCVYVIVTFSFDESWKIRVPTMKL